MKVEIARFVGEKYASDAMVTIHIIRTTCPQCHNAVQFTVDDSDKQYKDEVEYYKGLVPHLQDKIKRLNQVIDRMLIGGR
jgi:hypothetical protein